jgi:hypothetical protein
VSTYTLHFQILYLSAMTVVFLVIAYVTHHCASRMVVLPAVGNPPLLLSVGQALEFVGTTALVG